MATSSSTQHRRTPSVPPTVWPFAQTSAQHQRAGRHHPASAQHPDTTLPALAGRVVAEYSAPGALAIDILIEGAA